MSTLRARPHANLQTTVVGDIPAEHWKFCWVQANQADKQRHGVADLQNVFARAQGGHGKGAGRLQEG